MPVINKWENDEQTIYSFIMRGEWDWPEYQQTLARGYNEIATIEHNVDVIYAYVSALPPGDAVQYMMLASEGQPANAYRSVIVNPGRDILRMIVGAIDDMRDWDGPQFVDSLDEARTYLTKTE